MRTEENTGSGNYRRIDSRIGYTVHRNETANGFAYNLHMI